MKPEGMGKQTGRRDGIFKDAEAERSICKMLGEDEAGGRERGGGQVKRERESGRNWLDKLFCSS